MDRVDTRTHCRYCRGELTYDEKRNYKICLSCHPPKKPKSTSPKATKYVDVKLTEERVREIVRDELENWHIQKPPVTKDDIVGMSSTYSTLGGITEPTIQFKPVDYRQQAKELGIKTFGKKKVDVLKEIQDKSEPDFNK